MSTKVDGVHLIVSAAGQTYTMSPGQQESVFTTESETQPLLLRRRGRDLLELGCEGDRPNSFRRLHSIESKPAELGMYAGHFVNDESNVVWDLVVADGSLVITTAAGWRIPLAPAGADRFEVGPYLLEFDRVSSGIVGFRLHRERLWNLVFQRKPDSKPE